MRTAVRDSGMFGSDNGCAVYGCTNQPRVMNVWVNDVPVDSIEHSKLCVQHMLEIHDPRWRNTADAMANGFVSARAFDGAFVPLGLYRLNPYRPFIWYSEQHLELETLLKTTFR